MQGLVTGIFPVFEGCHGEGAALGQEVERYFQVAAGAVGDGAKEPSVAFLLGYNLILSGFGGEGDDWFVQGEGEKRIFRLRLRYG